jgi:hypothetical protein
MFFDVEFFINLSIKFNNYFVETADNEQGRPSTGSARSGRLPRDTPAPIAEPKMAAALSGAAAPVLAPK